jgi:hypothetical protein
MVAILLDFRNENRAHTTINKIENKFAVAVCRVEAGISLFSVWVGMRK